MKTSLLPLRIGFIDYCLNNFHADVFLSAIRGPLKSRGFIVVGAWALEQDASRAWAAENDVAYFDELEELDVNVDYFMILAPSNPELHLNLCENVFPYRKTTYVDKTFAPNQATAARIFALADHYGIAVQTSSALRYTKVQETLKQNDCEVHHLTVWGGGSSLGEYAIHVMEMVVSCMGTAIEGLALYGSEDHPVIIFQFDKGRTATINFNALCHVSYHAALTFKNHTEFVTVDDSQLFVDAANAILDFFEADAVQFNRAESLLIRHILDIVETSGVNGAFISLSDRFHGVPAPKGMRLGQADSLRIIEPI